MVNVPTVFFFTVLNQRVTHVITHYILNFSLIIFNLNTFLDSVQKASSFFAVYTAILLVEGCVTLSYPCAAVS